MRYILTVKIVHPVSWGLVYRTGIDQILLTRADPRYVHIMTLAAEILVTLNLLKPQLANQYQIKRFGLFGSVIREEQSSESDIDILVEFENPPSIFGFLELEEKLEEALQAPVDLVDIEGIKPLLRPKILSEVQYV